MNGHNIEERSISAGGAGCDALTSLHTQLANLAFPLDLPQAQQGAAMARKGAQQLDDYVIPRFSSLDAPLLAVVGGSTGAGKSTLVNSLLRIPVARASAIRPTTRRPTLVFHPSDAAWFESSRVLPSLARVSAHRSDAQTLVQANIGATSTKELALVPCEALPSGLALLDSPDIDSMVEQNRHLAGELLAAADLWIFSTTAARYADAVPWERLREAAERHVVIAVVLNRVPQDARDEVSADLSAKLATHGLDDAPLFVIPETTLDGEGFVPESYVQPLRDWIHSLAQDANSRAAVARTTLAGAVAAIERDGVEILSAYDEQVAGIHALADGVTKRMQQVSENVAAHVDDGTLLKGELLGRWQDIVGTGEWSRKFEKGISRLRDRITGLFTGKPPADVRAAERAIEDGVYALIHSELTAASYSCLEAWEHAPSAYKLVDSVTPLIRSEKDRATAIAALVHEWQIALLEMLRTEGASKKTTARLLSLGVNAVGVALIIVVFANTGGLVGGEVAVAGGTAVVAQKVLEAVFGDDAIRRMTARVKADLLRRVQEQTELEAAPFARVLQETGVSAQHRDSLASTYLALNDSLKMGR